MKTFFLVLFVFISTALPIGVVTEVMNNWNYDLDKVAVSIFKGEIILSALVCAVYLWIYSVKILDRHMQNKRGKLTNRIPTSPYWGIHDSHV